jgi:hypothetical protein
MDIGYVINVLVIVAALYFGVNFLILVARAIAHTRQALAAPRQAEPYSAVEDDLDDLASEYQREMDIDRYEAELESRAANHK